jgi:uncharacterized membrane protein
MITWRAVKEAKKLHNLFCPVSLSAWFGSLYCLRLGSLSATGGLICASDACAILQRTAIAKPLGIPLGFFGAAFYACVLVLLVVEWIDRRALLMVAGFGVLVSVTLLACGWVITGAVCLWCSVSTAASLSLLGTCASFPIRPVSLGRSAVALCLSGFLVIGAEAGIRRYLSLGGEYLATLPYSRLLGERHCVAPFDSNEVPRTALFVDLGCHSCRHALRILLDRRAPFALHFAGGTSDYGRPAAVALLAIENPRDRARLLSRLVSEDSPDHDSLLQAIPAGELKRLLTDSAAQEFDADVFLSRKIRIRGLPTVLERAEANGRSFWRSSDAP